MKLLTQKQEKAIQKMINDTMPDQLKLSSSLWARKAVKELVEREFEIVLAINTMEDYLRSWGFSPQKPKKKAYEQCPKKVQKWLDEQYPAIKKRAKEEGATIHWGGETGVRNNSQHGRSSRKLQQEFPDLRKRYWGQHFWAIGFGCWSTGNIADKMVNAYLEHHRKSTNDNDNFIIG